MARLIHVNGPPGIGKSTVATLFAERHPGTLNLDVDRLHQFVGGWRDPSIDVFRFIWPLALAMAAAHLAGGHDVVLPQYLASMRRIEAVEEVVADAGAEFHEVVLRDPERRFVDRFDQRPAHADDAWQAYIRGVVAERGGAAHLLAMDDALAVVLRSRPAAVAVPIGPDGVEAAYAALVAAVDR